MTEEEATEVVAKMKELDNAIYSLEKFANPVMSIKVSANPVNSGWKPIQELIGSPDARRISIIVIAECRDILAREVEKYRKELEEL